MTMTNRQPVTEAGRALLDLLIGRRYGAAINDEYRDAILAIETQASQLSEARTAELVEALRRLHDHGYQPMYNGRPSCPFCGSFVDDEETHAPGCVLVAALAATDATAPDAERAEINREMEADLWNSDR